MKTTYEEIEIIYRWLCEDYEHSEVRQMLNDADISYEDNDTITITYDNGVIDTIKIEDGKVTHISNTYRQIMT